MDKRSKHVVVIGAGVGGLAAAIRLARRGFVVKVVEAGSGPGGKMSEIRNQGLRFDTGPSLFTLPNLVEDLLGADFARNYHRLELVTRYFWEDKTVLDAWANVYRFAVEVESILGEPASKTIAYLNEAKFLYEHTAGMFVFNPITCLKTLFSKEGIRALKALPRLKAFRSLHDENQRRFSHKKTIQLFDRFATYNGSNPYLSPATLMMIPHLEHNIGAWFPEGGMYRIAKDLEAKGKSLGVEFHYSEPAIEIIMKGKRAISVKTSKDVYHANIVISDVDISRFYGQLLPAKPLPSRYSNKIPSSSALIFYWGVRRTSPMLHLHNILFSTDYQAEFEAIMQGKLARDLTVYIFISSKIVPDDAPKACENWFVMVNAPYDRGQNWQVLRNRAKSIILEKVKRVLGMDIEPDIIFEDYADPPTIARRTGSWRGALYGISSNDPIAAFMRHPNKVRNFSNIYFVGGSVHPGGGIPLCLASAQIVDKLIKT